MAKEKALFNLDRFRAEVKERGLAESNRFEIYMSAPRCLNGAPEFDQVRLASLFADQVAFPPLSLFVKQCRIYGPAEQRPITSDYGGDGMTIAFLVDRDMMVKQMFDYWMQNIVDADSHLVSFQSEYVCDMEIRQLDRADNVVYSVKLKDAFPRSLMQMDMNHANSGQYHRLLVSFAYHKWSVQVTGIPSKANHTVIPVPPDPNPARWGDPELIRQNLERNPLGNWGPLPPGVGL